MRTSEVSPSDLGHPSVTGHDHDGRKFTFKSSVQEREAFDVKHVNLVYKEHLGCWDIHVLGSAIFCEGLEIRLKHLLQG